MKSRNRLSHVLVAALVLGLTLSPFAVAGVSSYIKAGHTNIYSGQTTFQASNGSSGYHGYGTRFTNTNSHGAGGAILATHNSGAAMRATNKNSSGGLGLEVAAEKGPAAAFMTGDSTAAPFTVSNANKVTNLHADNSDNLNSKSPDHYASAGVKVNTDGTAAGTPTNYGLATTGRTSAGTYSVELSDTANKYLIQVTPATANRSCRVDSVSSSNGIAVVICVTITTNDATDSAFYLSATKP